MLYRSRSLCLYVICILLLFLSGCSDTSIPDDKKHVTRQDPLFTLLPSESTNIVFSNNLTEGLNTNVLMYEYFYNGGGVAVGDVNNDGLMDIYFTGNMVENKLYLNKGRMQFTDITAEAGVSGRTGPWKTGVTIADVNGDGKTDIYVCYSGKVPGYKRINQLFINDGLINGVPHFSEQAQQYGLADSAYSTQAGFFDFDKDGDLDMFLLNHNTESTPELDEQTTAAILKKPHALFGVKLYRNDKGHFSDITLKAGISNSALTYALGAGLSDVNDDGWPDIYISNDYSIPDYCYINNRNGTFSNRLPSILGHTPNFSMGNDIADINNDGLPDIYTLDMLPEDNYRQKLLFAPDNYEKFDLSLRSGFYYQYMRNMLQINNGNGTFSEIGQLAGVSNTDWSWSPLFADYDNDGWKDLFVTNGFPRDYTNMDFLKFMGDYLQDNRGDVRRENILDLVHRIPSSIVKSYMFRNNGDLTFSNAGLSWGFDSSSNSNGAAYGDLDNDGDLDMVVNNINQPAFVYRNEADKKRNNHFLQIKLSGAGQNTMGVGSKITIFLKGSRQYLEQMPMRGFQSSVSPVLHFGLGPETVIDSLCIVWPGGKQQKITDLKADQVIYLEEKNAAIPYSVSKPIMPVFEETQSPLAYRHPKSTINDFKRQPLLLNPLSFSGPCLIKGDVNGDGLEDVFAGGGGGVAGAIFLQQKNGRFIKQTQKAFEADALSEDADAVFFDANNDGKPDLYICSGGYHNYQPDDALLQDRLYLNDGNGNFIKDADALPAMRVSKSCVKVTDINKDGYADLFVGGRVVPGRYPETPVSYLLVNNGNGQFTDRIKDIAPSLQKSGMITDAAWIDVNNDSNNDLVVVGEWMPVQLYLNVNGKLLDQTTTWFGKQNSGWWNKLSVGDFNNDGKQDLIIGNLGLNTQCRVSDVRPADLYYKDFDDNGSIDPILCFYIKDSSFPYVSRDELLDQMSIMRTRFADYKSYANATLKDIFTADELRDVNHLQVNYLKTAYFESGRDGKFAEKDLPQEVQYSPVFSITPLDYDNDGNKDLLFCGNINRARLRFGKYDANYGVLLKGDGKGRFTYISQQQSGFKVKGDVRSVISINNQILFGINQEDIKAYKRKDNR